MTFGLTLLLRNNGIGSVVMCYGLPLAITEHKESIPRPTGLAHAIVAHLHIIQQAIASSYLVVIFVIAMEQGVSCNRS